MAVGDISYRSEYGSIGPGPGPGNMSNRDNISPNKIKDNLYSARINGPPSARSAITAKVTDCTRKITYNNEEWCELWDPDENCYYWYNSISGDVSNPNPNTNHYI